MILSCKKKNKKLDGECPHAEEIIRPMETDRPSQPQPAATIEAGLEALARGAWADARICFEAILEREETPEALEGLGMAAWWLEDVGATIDARMRAYRLHPLGEVLAGVVVHPVDRAPEVLRFYRDFTANAPDELTMETGFFTEDGNRLICIVLCYSGDLAEGERVIEPIRKFGPPIADMISPMPYTAFQSTFDEALPPGRHNFWKSCWLRGPSDDVLDTIVEHASAMVSPFSLAFLQHFHGAYCRIGAHETACPHRDPSYNLLIFASWTDPAESDGHVGWARDFVQAMQPYAAGKAFPNFLGQEEDARRVRNVYGENYHRLVKLKSKYDPDNFFPMNQNIKP